MKTLVKIFRVFRTKIKECYHNKWKEHQLGIEPTDEGVPKVEIDESEVIGNSQKILWMFGIID